MSDIAEILQSIKAVQNYLSEEWIVEGCGEEGKAAWGCASCQAVKLRDDLELLINEIYANAGVEREP